MLLIYEDKKKRVIKDREEIKFGTSSGFHLIILTGKAKSEKQISKSSTDDEELTVQIDEKKFPKLGSDSKKVLDSPASINGGKSHNLLRTVYFLTNLTGKDHKIILKTDNPPDTATIESLEVYALDLTDNFTLEPKLQAEDGDRREWITFVLDNLALNSFTVSLILKRRFIDSDDMKVVIDGNIQKNFRTSRFHKLWYFISSLFTGEIQSATFILHLKLGLHYIEFWADRMPTLNSIKMELGEVSDVDTGKLRQYEDDKFGHNYNQLDEYIIKATNFWNNFFSTQVYPPLKLLDPNLVKAIIYRESRLGYFPNEDIIDVMQVWDPRNPARLTLLGESPEREFISPDKIEFIHKFYPEGIIPKMESGEDSIFWGVRWLYHKAQIIPYNKKPYQREWLSWREAVRRYNANSEIVEKYLQEVFQVYEEGVDLEGNMLWGK